MAANGDATPQSTTGAITHAPNHTQAVMSRDSIAAQQALVLRARMKKTRLNGSTPGCTPLQTPATGGSSSSASGSTPGDHLIQIGIKYEDKVSAALTLAGMGADINDVNSLNNYANTKVETVDQVIRIIQSYHNHVIKPEFYHIAMQMETAFETIDTKLNYAVANLNWLTADHRKDQRQRSSVMVILNGFPKEMEPSDREYQIAWMMRQVNGFEGILDRMGLANIPHTAIISILAVHPITIKQGNGQTRRCLSLEDSTTARCLRTAMWEKATRCYTAMPPIHFQDCTCRYCSPHRSTKES